MGSRRVISSFRRGWLLLAALACFLLVGARLIWHPGESPAPDSAILFNEEPRAVTLISSDDSDEGVTTLPPGWERPSDEQLISLRGLASGFTDEELAFRYSDPESRFQETLTDWSGKGLLGLAKLERLLETLGPRPPDWMTDALLESLPPEEELHTPVYRLVFRHLGRTVPDTSLSTAMDRLPANDIRLYSGSEVVEQWATRNPEELTQFLNDLPDDFGKDFWIYQVPGLLMEKQPEIVMAWIADLGSDYRSTAAQHAGIQWANRDLQAAMNYSLRVFPEEEGNHPEHTTFCVEVGFALARQSPDLVIDWLNEMPPGETWNTCLENLLAWWVDFDPENASRWVSMLPRDGGVDEALLQFVEASASIDPAAAREWAGEIQSQDMRNAALREVDARVQLSSGEKR